MLSGDIDLDKLLFDMEQQIEILSAIAGDNAILNEQLRLLSAAQEALVNHALENGRLMELVDPDADLDFSTIMEMRQQDQD